MNASQRFGHAVPPWIEGAAPLKPGVYIVHVPGIAPNQFLIFTAVWNGKEWAGLTSEWAKGVRHYMALPPPPERPSIRGN